jgi:hypothetical protein
MRKVPSECRHWAKMDSGSEVPNPTEDAPRDPRARATIEVLGLNREAMAEFRFNHLKPFMLLQETLASLPAESEMARKIQALFEEAGACQVTDHG